MEKLNITKGDSYSTEIAKTIINQIDFTTMCSWGVSALYSCKANGMSSLLLFVNGFVHKGDVLVALNEVTDTYEVFILDSDKYIKEHRTDVYCDMLTNVLDELIERKPEWSDEKYKQIVEEWLAEK